MSASKEKKDNLETASSGLASSPRTAREARQRKEEKRSNFLYLMIAIIFVVVAVISITWKSGIVQKKATAATMNGENYTAAEVQYYYKNAYQQFVSNYSNYLSYFGLDTSKDLKQQKCNMTSNGGTWYDYFLKNGLDTMSAVHALSDAANKANFKWTDDMQSQYTSTLKSMKSSAKNYNYTLDQYVKAVYGNIVTTKVYEKELKLSILAQAYSNDYTDNLSYTTKQLTEAYKKNPDSFDVVAYQSVKVDGTAASASDSSSSSNSSSSKKVTAAEKKAAMATAKKTANSIYNAYQAGNTNLSALAKKNSKATYSNEKEGTYSKDSVLMKWLFDSSRKSGDSTVLEDKDNSTYYVVVFTSRSRYDYKTVNVRHILIKPATGTKKSGEDGYETEQKGLKAAAKKKAEKILAQWKSGDATEKTFAALAKKDSEDTGSNTNGGLYNQVYKNQMETAFNDWCFDSSRKAGDTGIVETSYGYHVIYFVGTDSPYWQVQVKNKLKENDYNKWYTKLTKSYKVTKHKFGLKYVG